MRLSNFTISRLDDLKPIHATIDINIVGAITTLSRELGEIQEFTIENEKFATLRIDDIVYTVRRV